MDYQNHYKNIIFKKDLFSDHKIKYKKINNNEVIKIFRKITLSKSRNINVLGYDGKENFEVYQPKVQQRYHEIKQFKLADYQKKLLNRLVSKPIDREKWLSAIGLAVVDKPISKLKDDEEETLFYNLETRLRELDSINEIGKLEINPQLEEGYHIELLPLGRSVIKENFKITKETSSEIQNKLDMIKDQLTGTKETDLSILIQLMEGMLRNGK